MSEKVIPIEHQKTTRGELFYFDDSGSSHPNRVIMLTTQGNLKILKEHPDWLGDGTFEIAPSFFKQIYTIHIVFKKRSIPLVYFFLPNKKERTYKKIVSLNILNYSIIFYN